MTRPRPQEEQDWRAPWQSPEARQIERARYEQLVKRVTYSPATGVFTWSPMGEDEPDALRWNKRYAGARAGSLQASGYRGISYRKKVVLEHRLAWFIVHGYVPYQQIDHINQDPSDNRVANLRDVSHSENMKNRRLSSRSTSGCMGVTWHKSSRKWCGQAKKAGTSRHLGLFERKEDAAQAARAHYAASGYSPNHGSNERQGAERMSTSNTNDRILLELAAKAAGMEGCAVNYGDRVVFLEDGKPAAVEWNPLLNDGDALRLAVKLCITDLGMAVGALVAAEGFPEDKYAATRRAIVRAAAAIGRTAPAGG